MTTAVQYALVLFGGVLLLATALPFIRSGAWWIRVFDFPRTQVAALLLAVFVASLFVLDPARPAVMAFLAALAAAFVYQAGRIFPYTPLASAQVLRARSCVPESRLRLLIANVLMDNRRAGDFLALVRAHDPDIVLAVETDHWWDGQLAALAEAYPFSVRQPIDNTYGMHLFSRLELETPEVRFLVEEDIPSIRTGVRLRSGAVIEFYGVHPRPPRPQEDTEQRDAELLIVGREIDRRRRPAIVAGDLNDVAWSHTTRLFQKISGTLDPRIGRGAFSTFHARYPFLRWALDHVFHEESFTLVGMKRLGYFGSDHFPMLIELCHQPRAAALQEPPAADREDREEAREKIAEGLEEARQA
jgi:endonuclease/exonuclease/phosphatase (EEP) superfamily protein YafD